MARELRVRDVMTKDVHGISEAAPLLSAAKAMAESGINALLVWPVERDEPYGIVTSSDLVDALAAGHDLTETTVGDFKTTPLLLVTPGVRARDVARMMSRMGVRHLVVFNGRDVVGIVANFDLLRAAAHEPESFRPAKALPEPDV